MGKVLLVDEELDAAGDLAANLPGHALVAVTPACAEAALAGEEAWDAAVVVLADAPANGLALCARMVAARPDVPVVIAAAHADVDTALAALRAGAFDLVARPLAAGALAAALERALRRRRLATEVRPLREPPDRATEVDGMIGASLAMRRVFEAIERTAHSDAAVLITGKSGTGKELVARALHRRGRHASGPFVAVNCAAIPEALLESELFGHVKGAFTSAHAARRGLFLQAHGGTILLDEAAEMPPEMQAKLLRVLEDKTVRAVGGDREEAYSARLITATNRDLETEVAEHRFREDLFYRINVIRIDMPPLHARGHDVLLLAQRFLERAAAQAGLPVSGFSAQAAARLLAYPWPGNVRELENCVERALAMARGPEIAVGDLPEAIRGHRGADLPVPEVGPEELLPMEEVERRHILHVLRAVGGSKSAAAAILGLHPSTLYRKLDHYGEHALDPLRH